MDGATWNKIVKRDKRVQEILKTNPRITVPMLNLQLAQEGHPQATHRRLYKLGVKAQPRGGDPSRQRIAPRAEAAATVKASKTKRHRRRRQPRANLGEQQVLRAFPGMKPGEPRPRKSAAVDPVKALIADFTTKARSLGLVGGVVAWHKDHLRVEIDRREHWEM